MSNTRCSSSLGLDSNSATRCRQNFLGFGRFREQAAAANAGRQFGPPPEDILKERRAEAAVFVMKIHAKSCKQRDRLRVTASSLTHARWSCRGRQSGHAPGVAGDH